MSTDEEVELSARGLILLERTIRDTGEDGGEADSCKKGDSKKKI